MRQNKYDAHEGKHNDEFNFQVGSRYGRIEAIQRLKQRVKQTQSRETGKTGELEHASKHD